MGRAYTLFRIWHFQQTNVILVSLLNYLLGFQHYWTLSTELKLSWFSCQISFILSIFLTFLGHDQVSGILVESTGSTQLAKPTGR
jgi:hypothetical protein